MGKRRRRKFLRFSPYIVGIGLAAGYIIKSIGGEMLEIYNYSSLRDEVVNESSTEEIAEEEIVEPTVTIEPEQTEEISESEEEIVEEPPEEPIEVISNELLMEGYEFVDIDFQNLLGKNDQTCGWIVLDGTKIDYPIVNATDEENSYYAHHDIEGNKSSLGTIYVDSRCNSLNNATYDLSDVTLIYGHHMTKGRMFASLCNYMNADYINEHPYAVIYTPDGYAYKLSFFAGIRYSGKDERPAYRDNLDDEEVFNEYITSLRENSSFMSDMEVNYGDKIVGLVTCEYSAGIDSDYRYALFGVLEKQYINELQIESTMDIENVSYGLK